MTKAGDAVEDFVRRLGPDEGLGCCIRDGDVAADGVLEFAGTAVRPATDLLFGEGGEPPLDQIDPRGAGRVKCKWKRGWRASHRWTAGVLWVLELAAQLARWAALGKALISTPTSAMITSAVRRLMPGILSSRVSWSAKGARRLSSSVLSVPIASSR